MPNEQLDGLIKFRCPKSMQLAFEAAARLDRRRPADLGRIIIEKWLEQNPAGHLMLRDVPNSGSGHQAAKAIVAAAAAHAATSALPISGKPIKYPPGRRPKKKPRA